MDVLGPADAGAPRTASTTSDVTYPASGDTWLKDCIANVAGTGTPIVQKFTNRLLQQLRRIIRLSGIPLSSNADDDMLGQAVQSNATNWSATFTGSVNALTATLSPTPAALMPGTMIRGYIAAANTDATTMTVPLASGSVTGACRRADGTAFTGGELVANGAACFLYVYESSTPLFILVSMLPVAYLLALVPTPPTYPTNGRLLNLSFWTTSGTYNRFALATGIRYTLVGPGGGGGGLGTTNSSQTSVASPGGSGALMHGFMTAPSSATITIGAPGAGGAAGSGGSGGSWGSDAGSVSFGSLVAPGGYGGAATIGPSSGYLAVARGPGAAAPTGGSLMNSPGWHGKDSYWTSLGDDWGLARGGYLGFPLWGAGGDGQVNPPSQPGGPGIDGAGGVVILEEYS